jgi:hypothetical protein
MEQYLFFEQQKYTVIVQIIQHFSCTRAQIIQHCASRRFFFGSEVGAVWFRFSRIRFSEKRDFLKS